MPLIIIAVLLIVGIIIYTSIKNKKEIEATEKMIGDKLLSIFERLINQLHKSSTTFTVHDDDDEDNHDNEKEEDKVLFFPNNNNNNNNNNNQDIND